MLSLKTNKTSLRFLYLVLYHSILDINELFQFFQLLQEWLTLCTDLLVLTKEHQSFIISLDSIPFCNNSLGIKLYDNCIELSFFKDLRYININ